MKDLEHRHQKALFDWAELQSATMPELALMFAVPNGGHRHIAVARKLKAEGVKPGVPDICLPVARNGFNALYIELKAPGGRPTQNQLDWLERLSKAGNMAQICYGWEAAKRSIEEYL